MHIEVHVWSYNLIISCSIHIHTVWLILSKSIFNVSTLNNTVKTNYGDSDM